MNKGMNFIAICCWGLCLPPGVEASNVTPETFLRSHLSRFYDLTDTSVMNEPLPKYAAGTQNQVFPNRYLRLEGLPPTSPPFGLLKGAQKKATDPFRGSYCNAVLSRHFPQLECEKVDQGIWAGIDRNDDPMDLLNTWVENPVFEMDKLPQEGMTALPLWSDDYWKTKWGITSYRYASGKSFATYREAVAAYQQPLEWTTLLGEADPLKIRDTVVGWSPAEKYDLTVGDESFVLTHQQKEEGKAFVGSEGDVESWMGICHGWAAASIQVPTPENAVTVVGARGEPVTWYPHDVRALASLAWANGRAKTGFVGGRCNSKQAETFPNGRLKDPSCFDNNPATFHIILANQVGLEKASFVMDAAYDYEVWNQPIHSYRFNFFNPLDHEKQSSNWTDVQIPYDETFKKKDRFQKPLTRGKRDPTTGSYDDTNIRAVVGVIARVTYLTEVRPQHALTARPSQRVDVYYEYDLELSESGSGGGAIPTGGEWHTNLHPDFLWVPERGQIATSFYDKKNTVFTGAGEPLSALTTLARKASRGGYPLCKVLSVLVGKSAEGRAEYECP